MIRRRVGVAAFSVLLAHGLSSAAVASAGRVIVATRAETPPAIDGVLDDLCWGSGVPTGDFILRRGTVDSLTQRTHVRVCYDDATLYVAFECLENRMDDISASIAARDAAIVEEDDCAGFGLDTFGDGRSCYAFATNPLGTEWDVHASECGRSQDLGWDAVWSVGTARFEDRWTAEFAVPLSAFRYRRGPEVVWGIDFVRSEKPHSETSSWSNGDGDLLDPSCWGALHGLSGLPAPGGLEVLPFAMAKYEAASAYEYPLEPHDSDWDLHPDAGLDVEYAPSANVTASFTLNPDFAQIEADPNQINLSGDELLLEERRPFFSENADVFQMPLSLFYTRKMEDIVCGAKVTGKARGASFATLCARSNDLVRGEDGAALTDSLGNHLPPVESDYAALIVRQDLLETGTLGGFFAARERLNGSSRVAAVLTGADAFEGMRVSGLAASAFATDPSEGRSAAALGWSYSDARSEGEGTLSWIEDGFGPETGYIPVDWRGRAGGEGSYWRSHGVDEGPIDQIEFGAWAGRFERIGGELEEYWFGGEVVSRLRGGVRRGLGLTKGWDVVDYPDMPSTLLLETYVITSGPTWAGYVGVAEFGDYHGSTYLRGRLGGRHQPAEPLTIEWNARALALRAGEQLDWWIGDLRASYRFSGSAFLRAIGQGMSRREAVVGEPDRDEQRFDVSVLYGWEFRPGSMLYVAFDQAFERADERSARLDPVLVIKMSHLIGL